MGWMAGWPISQSGTETFGSGAFEDQKNLTIFLLVAAPTHSFFKSKNQLRIKSNLNLEAVVRAKDNESHQVKTSVEQ